MKNEDFNEVDNVEEVSEKIDNPETATEVAKNTGVDTKDTLASLEKIDKSDDKKKRKLKNKLLVRNIIIGLLVAVIVILLIKIFTSGDAEYLINRVFNQENSELVENNKSKVKEHIDIPVIIDSTLTKEQPFMVFYNPETNADKFYLKYELHTRTDDKLLWSSDMVKPGQKFSANIYDLFEKSGTYYCYVQVRTFSVGSMTEANSVRNDIVVTIK